MVPFPIMASFAAGRVSKTMKKYAHGQGMGRHSKEEVREMGLGDLKALSDFLGKSFYKQ